jgi:2,3-bisphosphoglycerate-independent phosphoglycerate mutase
MDVDIARIWEDLILEEGGSIVYMVVGGMGGLPDPEKARTKLQVAHAPNLDRLARLSSCGLFELLGFQRYESFPSAQKRFRLKGLCIAEYPMYRGLSRLIGRDIVGPPGVWIHPSTPYRHDIWMAIGFISPHKKDGQHRRGRRF